MVSSHLHLSDQDSSTLIVRISKEYYLLPAWHFFVKHFKSLLIVQSHLRWWLNIAKHLIFSLALSTYLHSLFVLSDDVIFLFIDAHFLHSSPFLLLLTFPAPTRLRCQDDNSKAAGSPLAVANQGL